MTVSSSPTPPAEPSDLAGDAAPQPEPQRVVLLGNPNTGKTSLFNRLCGVRHKTSNFPGTTQEARVGSPRDLPPGSEIIDLPGIYSLELEQSEAEICRRVLSGELAPRGEDIREPDAVLVVADATNMPRSLMLVGEATRRGLPTVVAINQVDLSRRRGIHADERVLADRLGVEVIPCSAHRGGPGSAGTGDRARGYRTRARRGVRKGSAIGPTSSTPRWRRGSNRSSPTLSPTVSTTRSRTPCSGWWRSWG
ncbi:MAG: hypothetical protein HND58_03795 [Planctomycetota bacterium]|nr:MAG: hypothetical protein HND58_03795 [Planctomycetota bacterium]